MFTLDQWESFSTDKKLALIETRGMFIGLTIVKREKIKEALPLFNRFIAEAFRVKGKGRDYYSARTIVEVLRHHSVLEDGDKRFKICNDLTPWMSKLSMELFPDLKGFFKVKEGNHAFC